MHLRCLVLSIAIILGGSTVAFSNGPENAVVVVNAESASSKLVANFYVQQRKIPPLNVIYLSGIPRGEIITLEEFKAKILRPLLSEIDARKISSQIDYVIYSSGFPSKINANSARVAMRESDDNRLLNLAKSRTLAPPLSLTSGTFYYQSILTDQYEVYLGLNTNFYYRGKTFSTLTRPFAGKNQVKFLKATRLARSKELEEAITVMSELAEQHPLQMATHYWLARMHAQNNDSDSAAKAMKKAIECGWSYRQYTLSDAAFNGLENDKLFQEVLNSIPDFSFHELASQSFQAQHSWSYNGSVNSSAADGRNYLLATVLSVTRNQGISESQTLDYLERSINADASHPKGTFYFTQSGDIRTKTRQPNFEGAMAELKQLGYSSQIFRGRVPKNRFDILGLMIGTPKFDWLSSGSKILPGAICDNLTSHGGRLEPGAGQTKLFEFLRNGAAGSSGTVREPFALQAKFPHPRLHVHYVRGCTLAESFYQSVHGPFQLLIVGDALCKPFAKIPEVELSGSLVSGQELSGSVEIFVDSTKSPVETEQTEIFLDGRRLAVIVNSKDVPFRIDTNRMPDGFHEFRFVPVASGSIATKGLKIIPVMVNNRGNRVKLTASTPKCQINHTLDLKFEAPGASEVRLLHNARSLATSEEDTGQFTIKAYELGRGTVTVSVVANFDGIYVSGKPLELTIEGPISTKIPVIKSPPKPKR